MKRTLKNGCNENDKHLSITIDFKHGNKNLNSLYILKHKLDTSYYISK